MPTLVGDPKKSLLQNKRLSQLWEEQATRQVQVAVSLMEEAQQQGQYQDQSHLLLVY